MSDCLLTGGAGFIGSHLARSLLDQGYHVRILDNFSTGRWNNIHDMRDRLDVRVGDIRDADALFEAMLGVRYVFHLAALSSVARSIQDPRATHDINATGTFNVLLAAREAGVERVIFSSSSAVYGNNPELPKREDMRPQPLSPYALSKWVGEEHMRLFYSLYGLKTFSLRYFNVFGPAQDPASQYAAAIPQFINALKTNAPLTIYGDGHQTRDFVHVRDIVSGNLRCLEAPDSAAGEVYNLAQGTSISINKLVKLIGKITDTPTEPVYAPKREGEVKHSQADLARARKYLEWEPATSFEEGLQETATWFLGNDM